MPRYVRTWIGVTMVAALAACAESPRQDDTITGVDASQITAERLPVRFLHARVCPDAIPGTVSCNSLIRVDGSDNPLAWVGPSGYGPSDLLSAYNLVEASAGGSGQTFAIVDAYDDPNAESDLAVYRAQFGLPECTTENGCFRKVDQTGGTSYPRADKGWAEEISLDLDMASAICPNCKILLVEAKNTNIGNLGVAVDQAVALGATVVSNSYGGSEFATETNVGRRHYRHLGVVITVSSGDSGYGVEFPAASRWVTAVGGTTLTKDGGSWGETAWSDAGSGCSAYVSKPNWQKDTGCANRTVADVAAVADPNTGVAVYDTYGLGRFGGWLVFGGTSVSAPIIAGVYALAGNTSRVTYGRDPYRHKRLLLDVTSGSNGSCGGSYLCTAMSGYDGPTGLGTPNGTAAFNPSLIVASPTSLTFQAFSNGPLPLFQAVTLTSANHTARTGLGLATLLPHGWVAAGGGGTTTPATFGIGVKFDGSTVATGPGTYTATATYRSDNPADGVAEVPLTLIVSGATPPSPHAEVLYAQTSDRSGILRVPDGRTVPMGSFTSGGTMNVIGTSTSITFSIKRTASSVGVCVYQIDLSSGGTLATSFAEMVNPPAAETGKFQTATRTFGSYDYLLPPNTPIHVFIRNTSNLYDPTGHCTLELKSNSSGEFFGSVVIG